MLKCTKCQHDLSCPVSIRTEQEENSPIEISYQWWHCKACGTKYYATSEEDTGNMMDDRLKHKGYEVAEAHWNTSLALALQCPNPADTKCGCKVHRQMPPAGFYGAPAWYTYD